ncbi:HAMP domain-containing histidine kinase [Clostridium botulinum]|nr:HAMP domain-containing histidine kinase [Clostridium botulinum]NFG27485.1 HAMP domain-containing histidine kinase [Clostridium botulinum]NFR15503.1 HAMP domain-containing histidine kinase [Clostridium botulinum]NFR43985.1 HAMP domain-containing histidine kinase [Clostridium botulinum]NFS50985.1 HAMP domain-containing histidine kinase [Clostridium botulinum]
MKSIKNTLIRSFIFLILFIVICMNILLGTLVKKYYYDNAETLLKNQIEIATNFYNKYLYRSSLIENIYDNVDSFWNKNNAEVQILDEKGNLLMDSIGVYDNDLHEKPDVKKAINGESGSYVGNVSYSNYKVMSVSEPLLNDNEVIGIIRYVISLEEINNELKSIVFCFMLISILVLFLGIIISLILSNKIINPIKKLTDISQKMANGNLNVRNNISGEGEVAQLANTLDYMAEEIIKREKLKDDFISSVSHELRTPLTSIKGWVITLQDDNTDKETFKLGFNILEKETDRLSNMVEELLDFSRLINGKMQLKREKVNVMELIEYIESYMIPRALKECINFNVLSNLDNKIYYLDMDRMKQVLINLIDNSFKFVNKNGNVNVIFNEGEDDLKIVVEDNGCGISKSDLPKVKEKFYKGANSKSQNGIGLSICEEIVNLHNGYLDIVSEEGKMTRITILIPNIRETDV